MRKFLIITGLLLLGLTQLIWAQETQNIGFTIDSLNKPIEFSSSVNLLIAISSISLLPFLLISTTAFIRFAIVLGMLRQALGLNTSPPNQVIIALSMVLSIFRSPPPPFPPGPGLRIDKISIWTPKPSSRSPRSSIF